MMRRNLSQKPDIAFSPFRHLPVLAGAAGILTSAFCAGTLLNHPLGMALNLLSHQSGDKAAFTRPFGLAAGLNGNSQKVKVLAGISGITAAPGAEAPAVAAAEIVSTGPKLDVAPAAWDRLSGGSCMTVTTKSGETLSFRILGVRAGGAAKTAHEAPKLDLAITPCPAAADSVVKAVIEPYAAPAKTDVPARNL
jgi:hypothetical protein